MKRWFFGTLAALALSTTLVLAPVGRNVKPAEASCGRLYTQISPGNGNLHYYAGNSRWWSNGMYNTACGSVVFSDFNVFFTIDTDSPCAWFTIKNTGGWPLDQFYMCRGGWHQTFAVPPGWFFVDLRFNNTQYAGNLYPIFWVTH